MRHVLACGAVLSNRFHKLCFYVHVQLEQQCTCKMVTISIEIKILFHIVALRQHTS